MLNSLLSLIPDTPSVAIIAMMVACALPFVFAMIAKMLGGFKETDNARPREFLAQLTGMPARANAIQQNSFESLPMFLSAVLLAMMLFAPQSAINILACLYVAIRIGYGIAYLMNLALFRSILWMLSMACIVMLFVITLRVL